MTEAELDALSDEEFAEYMDSEEELEESQADEIEDETAGEDEPESDVDTEETGLSEEETEVEDYEDTDPEEAEDEEEEEATDDDQEEESTETEPEKTEEENTQVDDTTTDEADSETEAEAGKTINEAEYEKYKRFYDEVVNSEFTANGQKMRGFDDPKKIISSIQKAAGFDKKVAGFKKYRPALRPLEERGLVDNENDYNLMLSMWDGDIGAIKQHLKNKGIDPIVELDTEEGYSYTPEKKTANEYDLVVEDLVDVAKNYGVNDKLQDVLSGQWDRESVGELLVDKEIGTELIEHMNSGLYDSVQARITEKSVTDASGAFGNMSSLKQYKVAVNELRDEFEAHKAAEAEKNSVAEEAEAARAVEAEKAKIEAKRKADEYAAKVKQQEEEVAKKREAATKVSKKKKSPTTKKSSGAVDPMKLDDDAFAEYMDSLMG